MKILCDVCCKEEASAFCCADEAALCEACDLRVHPANKLAGKHRRLSLSAPTAQSHPVCDICQENRGFLFCQEDRAILCRDCDASVHSANHLTMKHNRFILTGVRLSAAPVSSFPSPVAEATAAEAATNTMMTMNNQNTALVADVSSPMTFTSSSSTTTATSNISEYLIKMCPGWRVDDLLVDDEEDKSRIFMAQADELL
ncbi:hypothetical protein B296_00028720 [Ensete ventricosum]|uniref:B box-type domain-containing protein n=1 Tax=Ensete ventricosum TaxID=4639 RepID=A0A426ZAP7_ENSVE|nr:hypothetical protein B296_00028720 [Ensete ventricosum]